jgi:peptidoglycan/xylan/chitin deacetylase (PgdA/CDA1 family)
MRQKVEDSLAMPLNYIASEYYDSKTKSKYDDASDVISDTHAQRLMTRAIAAIERATGKKSVYYEQAIGEFNKNSGNT